MDGYLRQSTASQTRWIGPFVDDTDFKTAETGLTVANTDIKVSKNGAASASKNSGGGTHDVNGNYAVTWDATDTATVGQLAYTVKVAGALQVWGTYVVLEEVVYDALMAASALGYVANAPVTLADAVAHGGTLGSSTATLALSRLTVVSQTANTAAVTATGNGTGSGVNATSGSGATGNGISATAASTDGHGFNATGNGGGSGLRAQGGATGNGMFGVGGSSSGNGFRAQGTAGNSPGMSLMGQGTAAGLITEGGATGNGATFKGGATSGHGIQATVVSGNEIDADLTGAIVGSITGSLSGSVGSVTGAVGSVTGAVGSVTGAVGSVTGAVGSVTGAVGSVTGNVGGNVVGSVGSLTTNNDKTGYSIASGGIGAGAHAAAELNSMADAFLNRNMATGTDSGTDSTAVRTVRQALRRMRNKEEIAAGTLTIYKEDDSTASWTAAATTSAGNPLSAIDPT